ncbi:MAG TPA: hypothetical protein VIY68_02335 [Steroidobacteraceae bacterium]
MGKRRTLAQQNGAAVCAALCEFEDARRYELGVEALCQLATDVVVALSEKSRRAPVPGGLIDRYWGIMYACSDDPVVFDRGVLTRGTFIWICLTRAIRWTNCLVRVHSIGRWAEVQEIIIAWQDAWGIDARALYAQARFSTLTGLGRAAGEEPDAYMDRVLIKALSDVQA